MYDIRDLPEFETNYFMRWVAKATKKYFEDPDVQRRFDEWMAEKERNRKEATT